MHIIERLKTKYNYDLIRCCDQCYTVHQLDTCNNCGHAFVDDGEALIESLLEQGFTEVTPTKSGLYWVACNEVDFEPFMCKVQDGFICDPELGTMLLTYYDLTDLFFKRVEHY